MLIQTITNFSSDLLNEISPQSRHIKPIAKAPMVSLLCLNALSGGFSVSIYKVIGELLTSSTIDDAGFLIAVLFVFAIASNALQMHLLNLAMKYYDQIEVIPI